MYARWRRSSPARNGSSGPRITGSRQPTPSFAHTRRTACGASVRLDPRCGHLEPFNLPFTDLARGALKVGIGWAAFISGSPTQPKSVVKLDLKTGAYTFVVESSSLDVAASYFSEPESIAFPTEDGKSAHAFYYPPTNPDFKAPADERPPMIVISHGGPTGATSATLDLETQFWTSRGFAVLDVNYGGSTGYGTEYRRRLNGRWGIVDIDDCVNGAQNTRCPPGAPTESVSSCAEAARAGIPRWRAWPSATCSRPGRATTGSEIWRRSPGTRTSSSRDTSTR